MITSHQFMLEDKTRCESYLKAIQQIVKKGDVVADIGTGSGLLAFFAARAGAKKVYAIEADHIIEDAKRAAAANGLTEKIVFIKGLSTAVDLPEKVDVIVSELMGSFGIDEHIVRYLSDAKTRFLKAGGKIIPSVLETFIAPVEAQETYEKTIGFWEQYLYGLTFTAVRGQAVNSPLLETINPEGILAGACCLSRFDFEQFYKVETLNIDKKVTFDIKKEGFLHGFCGWFSVLLSKDVSLANAPLNNTTHWRNIFLPVENPVLVKPGDMVSLRMIVQPFYDANAWTWTAEIKRAAAGGAFEKTVFRHSTLKNLSPSKEWMQRQRLGNNFIPVLSREDRIRLFVLKACDGAHSTEEITDKLLENFSDAFRSRDDALNRVLLETRRCKIMPL